MQFAGCREADYSYGGDTGGTWTQSLLQTLMPMMTWREWFDAAKAAMPDNQVPMLIRAGTGSELLLKMEVWK